ncbi:MAG: ABC transporter permease subunit [Defluviitaleaceae bacterium]|nr:ABC transporter permease subunit [Defluviitaleaceae bacterium]
MGPSVVPDVSKIGAAGKKAKGERYFGGGLRIIKRFKREWPLHMLILPALVITAIFSYGPMYGLIMAFQDFNPVLGFNRSPWIGLDNFRWLFSQPQFIRTIPNTFFISIFKIGLGTAASVIFALLLNEIRRTFFKRFFQTIVYVPNFISWVILAGVMQTLLASDGLVNNTLMDMGMSRVAFLANPDVFPWTMIWSDVWKTFGFGTVVYLATITSIDPELYESAVIDGAGRFKQTMSITLPLMGPIIVLMVTLALGNVLSAGFDQIFNLYSAAVYSRGDIIDTYLYRLSFQNGRFAFGAAVGLMRSVVSMILISVSLWIAYKVANYKIF